MLTIPAQEIPKCSFRAAERERSVRNKTRGSCERYERACRSLAGGVSSGLRRAARPYPLYYSRGCGPRLVDVDENTYLDYTLAWGPTILGHAPRAMTEAVSAQAARGLTFGAQHDLEIEVAEKLVSIIPCADAVCYLNSGTEVVQVALRLARAATGRTKYLKFEGHYHGWDDTVLVSYHPTLHEIDAAQGRPVPVGAGQLVTETVVVAQWNDRAGVEAAFATNPGEMSAIICEPLLANSGCIPPARGFLEFLREVTSREGALLIFDEVITGFRLDLRGAQGFYGVVPDLATYGKAVGGGVSFSVLAGKAEHMELISSGKVVHAGTLNGSPLSLAAAKVALDELSRGGDSLYEDLRSRGQRLRQGLAEVLRCSGQTVATNGEGALFHLAFMARPAHNYRDLLGADNALYSDFALAMLDEGVLVLPDGRWYLSTAHTDADIEATLAAAERAAS